jgi:outer membrane cobalamin receptor
MKRSTMVAMLLLSMALPPASLLAEERTTQLKEVVVTATKTEKDPNDVTQAVTVVTGEEIRKSGATDVATAIQNSTGVTISTNGTPGSVESLQIRGAYSAQNLVLLNGIRMNSARDGGFDLSLLPVSVEDIERIEIVRGSASALYGSDAVGGVINIITKKPAVDQSLIRGAIGSHGYDDIFLNNSGRTGQWYYTLSGERETSNGYRQNSDLRQWVAGGKAGYDFSSTSSIELSANYLENDLGSPGSTIFGETPNARQQERTSVTGAAYNVKLVPTLDIKLSGYHKQDDLSFADPDAIDFMTLLPAPMQERFGTRTRGGEAQMSWLVTSWNQLTAGYEVKQDNLDSFDAQSGTATHSASLRATYFQDEISIGEPLIIMVGGRHDDYSTFGEKFSPKASARYYIKSSGTIIRASYGKSFRAPTFNDLFFESSSAIGNPDLRPESAKEYEAGIEQKIGDHAVFKITEFDRRVTDLIQWNWWDFFPMQPQNIGRVSIHGVETEASYRLAEVVSMSVNYTYLNPIDEGTGLKIYNTIPHSQTKGVITLYPDKDVYLTLEGRSVRNYLKPDDGEWRYSVMDAKIAEKFGDGSRGEFFFAMNNVFDRKYEVVQGYPMPPREIRGGVSLPF